MDKSQLIDLFAESIRDYMQAETKTKRSETMQVIEKLAMFLSDKDKELATTIAGDKVIKAARKCGVRVTPRFGQIIRDMTKRFSGDLQMKMYHYSNKAIKEIDKSIAAMEKVKKELTTSGNQFRLANQKADDLTIKKLTHGNPTMKEKFNEIN